MGIFTKNASDGKEITLKLDSSFYDDAKDVAKIAGGVSIGMTITCLLFRLFGGK